MKMVVTGSAGFIGQATKRLAVKRGHDVLSFDRRYGRDVLKAELVNEALRDADVVIHLAGVLGTSELYEGADTAVDVNVKGALRVLQGCRDNNTAYVGITMPDCWSNLYQATKIAAQRIAIGFHQDYGVPVTLIRAFNAYGPGQAWGEGHPQKIIPTFASLSWRGKPMPIWGDGEQLVDLVHVDDIARDLVYAAEGENKDVGQGQIWDSGNGNPVSVIQVAHQVGAITGNTTVEFLPMRRGETPGTRICAEYFAPWVPHASKWSGVPTGEDELRRFREAVESYKP